MEFSQRPGGDDPDFGLAAWQVLRRLVVKAIAGSMARRLSSQATRSLKTMTIRGWWGHPEDAQRCWSALTETISGRVIVSKEAAASSIRRLYVCRTRKSWLRAGLMVTRVVAQGNVSCSGSLAECSMRCRPR